MAKKSSYFVIGLFVSIGVLVAAALIVWLGASKYFQKGTRYVTYFDESVQGLQVDSSVKYRGVEVGNVEAIRVATDNKLIAVVMKVDLGRQVAEHLVAQLRMVGITGIVFIELDLQMPGDAEQAPKIAFTPPCPVILSKPSEIRQIFARVDQVIQDLQKIDFEGISTQSKATMKAVQDLVSGEEIKEIMANVREATDGLKNVSASVQKAIAEGKLEETIASARQAVNEARQTIQGARTLIEKKMPESVEKTDRLISSLGLRSRSILADVQTVSENLRRISDNLDVLVRRLQANPSELLFGKEPPLRRGE